MKAASLEEEEEEKSRLEVIIFLILFLISIFLDFNIFLTPESSLFLMNLSTIYFEIRCWVGSIK